MQNQLSKHHIKPQSRFLDGKNPHHDNIVRWWPRFHQRYHDLFKDLLLCEIHQMLDILAFSERAWTRCDLRDLRRLLHSGDPLLEAIRRSSGLTLSQYQHTPQRPAFMKQKWRKRYGLLFRNLPLPAQHAFLDRISVPHERWGRRQIRALQNRLEREYAATTVYCSAFGWHRRTVQMLRERIEAQRRQHRAWRRRRYGGVTDLVSYLAS